MDISKFRVWVKQNKAVIVFVSLMVAVVLLYVAMFYTEFTLGYLIMVLILSCPALCLSLQSSEVRKTFRKSLGILYCGLSKPINYFIVVFLIGLGILFIVEEVTKGGVQSILDHIIATFQMNTVTVTLTLRNVVLLILSLTSSVIAIQLTSKTPKCYRKFLKYASRVAVYTIYPIVIAVLGLICMGLGGADLRLLTPLGFAILILWLYIWSSLSIEVWIGLRKKQLDSADA